MKIRKILSIVICMLLLLETFSVGILAADTQSKAIAYEDSFDYASFGAVDTIYGEDNIWEREFNQQNDPNIYGYRESSAPQVKDGVLKFNEGDGVRINWTNIDGFSFNSSKTYTITFDFTITNFGDDAPLSGSSAWNREFYFAVAGYYNQIEFRNANFDGQIGIRAGDKSGTYPLGGWTNDMSTYKIGTVYSAVIEWVPAQNLIISTVKNGETVIAKGSRSSGDYGTLNKYTKSFVWRCEDGNMEIDNVVFSDGSNSYSQNFTLQNEEDVSMTSSGIWGIENVRKTDTLPAKLENGVLKIGEKSGVRFNWTEVEGVGEYSTSKSYSFDFDFKVTDKGDGSLWGGEYYTRALYVGFGGWYTFIELYNKDSNVKAGGTSVAFDQNKFINKDLHASLVWEGNTIYATITDAEGNVLVSGSRSENAFIDMNIESASMTYLVLRCEDGAVEVDNFKFAVESNEPIASTDVFPAVKHQTVYEADIEYSGEGKVSLKLDASEVLSIANNSVRLCGKGINASFGAGTYKVTVAINPTQNMLSVELIAPNGDVVRRAFYAVLGGTTMNAFATSTNSVTNITTKDAPITVSTYELTTTEPSYSGTEVNIYNVVTSFNDAQTTRNFAWTVNASFLGSSQMSLKYRKAGTEEWTVVDGVKEQEEFNVSNEDYFKCDISGLEPDTAYEYTIGLKGNTQSNKWTDIYSFKTAPEQIDAFTFIAVGDTQGITWNGLTDSDKGFMFAKAAYEEAFKAVEDPAFILHTGDVVEWGGNKQMWNWYFKALSGYGTSTPLFATMGNHDTWANSGENLFFDYHFNHPNNGGIAALDQNQLAGVTDSTIKHVAANADETIYSYDYGDVHFISINSGAFDHNNDSALILAQREWLRNDLEANKDAKWIIMFQHQPVYHRSGGESDRGNGLINDLIESYGVDLVIQGHSHLVTRSYPMKDGEIATKTMTDKILKGTGTIYTTIGSCALNHDGISDSENVEEMFSISIPTAQQATYTTVSVDDDKIVVTTKQLNGLVLDEFAIVTDLSVDIPDDDTNDKEDEADKDDDKDEENKNDKPEDNTEQPEKPTEPGATDKTTEPEATEPEKKSGCKASLASTAAVIIAVLGFGSAVLKKKE